MKRTLIAIACMAGLVACGNSTENMGNERASEIDTTSQPGGVVNSNVISTDTAAINMQNSIDKVDSMNNK